MKIVSKANEEIKPLPADTSTEDAFNALAELVGAQWDAIERLVESMPDESIVALAKRFGANEGCYGFRVEEYDCIADKLYGEVGVRRLIVEAKEHMKKTGEGMYCPSCGGSCDMGEEHNKKVAAKTTPRSPEVMELHGMSRSQLIEMLTHVIEEERVRAEGERIT
jgi:hypothetical protein